ncbi:hypothetical protein I314_01643 [Cryptococcus bacillisporus CA1873]|uniref:Nuclear speckle splicing regulatory protein 1 N-terminal domain-containing protein n=1 Tax=Cryptococcus bacillisporus CA1873 TaxID=1296111 RepID=A0ABR5BG46_CRYGA|nr:hypothetical protein I314_01643 [Cryptococcus bacillisporus CA1873]|eukprot:KIR68149.1 hypothetical protein I314_01643 [Cryptococcus gattii CA1873]
MSHTGKQKASNISHGTLLDLKAITAEHVDRFAKEGKGPVKGHPRKQHIQKSRDPFDKPSPGLVKRLAAEARNDAKRRRFDNDAGPTEEERRDILKAKAKKYEQIKKGDFSGLSQKEIEEAVIDFEKLEEFSDRSSDEDESAHPARLRWSDDEAIEYIDELGRTRTGTRKEAKEAERLRGRNEPVGLIPSGAENSAYAEVQQSKVIHGEQHVFPVYEPNPEVIKAKYREAEEEARGHHYDSTKEVRVKGAGQYQFSLDEQRRAEQQAALKSQRHETELARAEAGRRGDITAAQEARKKKLEQRKAMIEAKRAQLFGGEKEVQILKEERKAREADEFLNTLQKEWEGQ